MQSRDIHITAPCVAELVTTRLPDLGEREVRIRLTFSTISSGTERANVIGDPNTAFDPHHQVRFPITDLGYSASGTVLEVGAEVTDLAPGDRVAVSWSHHGEIIQVNRARAYKLPDNVSFADAALFHIGYMYRYNPMVLELLAQIERGELGQLVSVDAQMSGNQEPELRQWLPTFKGGHMFYLGCHIVDLAFRILGQPTEVLPLNFATGVDGIECEDFSMAVLRYPKAIATVRTDGIQHGGYLRRELVVTGSKKTVELRPIEMVCPGGQISTRTEYDAEGWFELAVTETTEKYLRYGTMLRSFAAMVRGEMKNPYTPDYELSLFKLILKCCGAKK